MFEGLVHRVVVGYLGRFFKDIQKDQLKLSLWDEEVLLENVELIPEAFDYLRLPLALKYGRVGRLSIKVSWKKLGWDQPIFIALEDVFICATQRDEQEWCLEEVEKREFAGKKAQLAAAELAKLSRRVDNQAGQSFISYITAKVLDSIQVSIRDFHIQYRENLFVPAQVLSGVKFSSLTIRQNPVGSYATKVIGGQVNKIVDIEGLAIYCHTFEAIKSRSSFDAMKAEFCSTPRWEGKDFDHLFQPLNVSVSLVINKLGKLDGNVPQFSIRAELSSLVLALNEVQLQQVLMLMDYLNTSRLREKYGRYRPWGNSLSKKEDGWQRSWWHYAQNSVRSDVRNNLKKTSWRYLGQRLISRRKYIKLYKKKLDFLQSEQPIDEDILVELEEIEKESDVDDILSYRSAAENELQEMSLALSISNKQVVTSSVEKTQSDVRSLNRPRGWLNWLSRGMLGAGGTDDSGQFSGVISDEVVKDIYEATKFHPSVLSGSADANDKLFSCAITFSIAQITATLCSKKSIEGIGDLIFKNAKVECKLGKESSTVICCAKVAEIVNPCSRKVILQTGLFSTGKDMEVNEQSACIVQVDVSMDQELTLSVMLQPVQITLDMDFLANIIGFFSVLKSCKSQPERVLLSLNGIKDLKTRLSSKAESILSARKKLSWNINFRNVVVNIPHGRPVPYQRNLVLMAGSFLCTSKVDVANSGVQQQSCILKKLSGCSGDSLGITIEDLYNLFDISIIDIEVKLLASEHAPSVTILEKFCPSITFVSCIVSDESILKQLEVSINISSVSAKFSPSIYGSVLEVIAHVGSLNSNAGSLSLIDLNTSSPASSQPWVSYFGFTVATNIHSCMVYLDFENEIENSSKLSLSLQELYMRYSHMETDECQASIKELRCTSTPLVDGHDGLILCSSKNQFSWPSKSQNNFLSENINEGDAGLDEVCLFIKYEACQSVDSTSSQCKLDLNDVDLHCHPHIIGLLRGLFGKISADNASNKSCMPERDDNQPTGFGFRSYGISNFYESSSLCDDGIPLDFYPFVTVSNDGHIGSLEKSLRYPCSDWRELFSVRNGTRRNLKSNWKKDFDSFSAINNSSASGVSSHKNTFSINIFLSGLRVFFHDSACVVGTLLVPTSVSSVLVHDGSMDVLCSTEGLILTSSLWTHMSPEFLWGPIMPNISPILNVRIRKGLTRSLNSEVEVSIGVQHINCALPAEYLAILIGYFSLPDWEWTNTKRVTQSPAENGSPVVYKFEILDSIMMLPVDEHDNQFIKLELKQLYCNFVHNCSLSQELENIYPKYILSAAHEIPSRNHFLSIFGRDVFLSLLQFMDKDGSFVLGQDTRCKDICLLAPLNADIWVRIPNGSELESETASNSTSIMVGINNSQLFIDGCSDLNEFEALMVVIDQFSSISKYSKTFTSVPHFLQLRKGFRVEETDEHCPDITPSTAFTELLFSVDSLTITFLDSKPNIIVLEQLAKAQMQFVCTASFVDDVLMDLDFSLASLLLSSLLNPVILAQCTKTSSNSAFQICLKNVGGDSLLDISLPSLDVWLHLFDWFSVINIYNSWAGRVSQAAFGNVSSAALPKSAIDGNGNTKPPISPESESAKQDCSSLIVKSENIGLTIYFPVKQFEEQANPEGQSPPCVLCRASDGKHHEYVVITTLSRSFELHMVSSLIKLTSILERTSGAVGMSQEGNIITWPLFQISQVIVVAKIGKGQTELVDINLGVECHRLDFCLSHQVLCFLHDARFDIPEGGGSSPSSFGCIDLNIETRKISLLISDERWSFGGPLLEILMKGWLLRTTVTKKVMETSVKSVLEVNYNNIHKVLWESFVEPWGFEINFVRKYDPTPLLSSSVVTDINLASSAQLNLNITESLIECVCMTAEMLQDAWNILQPDAVSEGRMFPGPQPINNMYDGRYAPYLLENLTSLPLIYHVSQGLGIYDASDVSVMKDRISVQPGACIPIYVNETPEEQLLRYRPAQSSDRLSDKQSSGVVHHFMCVQLDGTSQPSVPISMDLVGLTYFEVEFSKTSSKIESDRIIDVPQSKFDDNARTDAKHGFVLPVVFDVSVKRYSKLIRLYSTVILSNATSVPLELRFDIPFGVAPKILDPIYPGQEFPLPLHLAEAGRMRWRPIGDTLLWSEVHELSNVISQESKIGFLRSSVCYPCTPSSDPFRCCISVQHFRLPSACVPRKGLPLHGVSTSRQSAESNSQVRESSKRFVHQIILGTPITMNNYIPDEVSLTIESGGISCVVPLTEEKTSFHHVDPSHDVLMELCVEGFRASSLKFPSVEAFSVTSKFSGTKFSSTETLALVPDSPKGPVHVIVEKVMDAFSGQREVFVFSTFLLYNCTGFLLNIVEASTEGIGHCCTLPSYIKSSDPSEHLQCQKKGMGLLSVDKVSHSKYQNIEGGRSSLMTNQFAMHINDVDSHFGRNTWESRPSSHCRSFGQSTKRVLSEQRPYLTSSTSPNVADPTDAEFGKVKACMFSPLSISSVSEVMVKVSMYPPEDVTGSIPNSSWSEPFPLVPPSGSSTVLVPRVSSNAVHVISVSSSSITGPLTGRSQAITFQPRYVISNACRRPICYKQKGTDTFLQLGIGQHASLDWTDKTRELLVSVRFNEPGWEWSGGFLPDHLGDTQVKTRNYTSGELQMVRVEVRNADVSIGDEKIIGSLSGNSGTNLVLLSDDDSGFMPYRIDNFSKERLRVYQQRCETFDTMVHPYATCPYAWDEPCYPHRLAIEVPGERVVGLYSLDVMKEHAAVHIKATSEKPERTLLVSVRAEGAIKVLSIIDSSYHVFDLEDRTPTWFQQNSEPKPETYVDYEEKLSLAISHVGISLVNNDPQELLFACAKNITLELLQSLDQQKLSFEISSLQIDNQLATTPYPVILSFNQENKSSACSQKSKDDNARSISDRGLQIASNPFQSVLHLAVATWRKKDSSLLSFECISLRVADFRLELEQEVILSLLDYFKAVSAGSRSKQLPFSDPAHIPLLYDTDNNNYVISRQGKHFAKHLAIRKSNIGCGPLPSVVPIGAPWQNIYRLAGKQKKIYVEVFDLSPIKFTLSFSSSPWILRNGILTSGESLIHKRLMAVADVEGARINLKQLTIAHQMASLESMRDIIIRHYTRQLLHEIYKVFGSAGVIGNPMGVARSLGLGVRDFLSVPAKSVLKSPSGLITGMAQGTGSLVSNTVYALSDAATQFSKAAHKGIVAFTFDDQAVARMEKLQKGAPPQSKGVISEVLEGLTGLLQSPIKEAEKHGLPGIFSGLALGITGLVAKPAASLLEVTGKTAQSIRNRSRLYHQRYRVRFPRPLSPQLPLRPYCMEEAIGTSVLSGKLKDEVLVVCRPLKVAGKFVLVTERLVLKVYSWSLVDLGNPGFQGVPTDPDWLVESEIGLDSVIHADTVDGVVHIVGSSSDALVRQNQLQHSKDSKARRQWTNPSTPLPLFQTNLELHSANDAQDLLHVLMSTIEGAKGKRQGCGYVLHRSNMI